MAGKHYLFHLLTVLCFSHCAPVFSQTEESDKVTFINTTVQWCNGSEWYKSCDEILLSESSTLPINKSYIEEGFVYVSISHQDVPVLYRNSLVDLRISALELTFCGLSLIEDGAFQDSQISSLSLSHNNLTRIGRHTFKNITVIWDLNLDQNAVTTVERGAFDGMNLEVLDLSNNDIEEIALGVFDNISVGYLSLKANKLKSIPKKVFQNMRKLRTLDLSYNMINSVEFGLLESLPQIKFLYLNNNLLQEIPENTFSFRTLTRLNLRGNNIDSIPLGAFNNSTFRYLNLAGNKLEVIRNGIFNNNSVVYYLNLSKNSISEIEPNALDAVYGGIDLQFNNLAAINRSTFNNAIIVELLNNKKLRKTEDGSFNGRISKHNFYVITPTSRPTLYINKEYLIEDSKRYLSDLEKSGNFTLVEKVNGSVSSFTFNSI